MSQADFLDALRCLAVLAAFFVLLWLIERLT